MCTFTQLIIYFFKITKWPIAYATAVFAFCVFMCLCVFVVKKKKKIVKSWKKTIEKLVVFSDIIVQWYCSTTWDFIWLIWLKIPFVI